MTLIETTSRHCVKDRDGVWHRCVEELDPRALLDNVACGYAIAGRCDSRRPWLPTCEECLAKEQGDRPMTLIETTNWGHTRRHLADAGTPQRPLMTSYPGGGREGLALCDGKTSVYDQEALNAQAKSWGSRLERRIDALPLCKRCERKAAKLGAEAAK